MGYYLELLTPETIKLLGSTKSKKTKKKNGENILHLEITELVRIHLYLIYFWSIIRYFTKKCYIFENVNSEFSYIDVWFTDQNSEPLEIEDKINITLVIN